MKVEPTILFLLWEQVTAQKNLCVGSSTSGSFAGEYKSSSVFFLHAGWLDCRFVHVHHAVAHLHNAQVRGAHKSSAAE